MSEKLRPCPFCGGDDIQIEVEDAHQYLTAINLTCAYGMCLACGARGPVADDYDEAAAAWNAQSIE